MMYYCGGHAGVEAAIAADRIGANTALISFKKTDLGVMSSTQLWGGWKRPLNS